MSVFFSYLDDKRSLVECDERPHGECCFRARGKNVFAMREKAQGNESQSKCRNIRHYEKLITTVATRFWRDM